MLKTDSNYEGAASRDEFGRGSASGGQVHGAENEGLVKNVKAAKTTQDIALGAEIAAAIAATALTWGAAAAPSAAAIGGGGAAAGAGTAGAAGAGTAGAGTFGPTGLIQLEAASAGSGIGAGAAGASAAPTAAAATATPTAVTTAAPTAAAAAEGTTAAAGEGSKVLTKGWLGESAFKGKLGTGLTNRKVSQAGAVGFGLGASAMGARAAQSEQANRERLASGSGVTKKDW